MTQLILDGSENSAKLFSYTFKNPIVVIYAELQ